MKTIKETPTNALSAIHAIALKKGFPAEEIEAVQLAKDGTENAWGYRLNGCDEWHYINLSNDQS